MKQLLWIAILLTAAAELFAQRKPSDEFKNFNPHFEIFSLPGGALGNSVQGIVQDSTGFLWFASQGGLHRYDGQNFVTYRHDPNNPNSLANNYCEYVFLDSQGVLWVAHYTEGGLTSFDPSTETFTRYYHDPNDPESLSSNTNSIIAEDREGYIWIGGDGGLDRLDRKTGKFKRFHNDPNDPRSLSYNQVRGLYVDRQGALWVGTSIFFNPPDSVGGLNRYDPKTESFTRYRHDPNEVNSLIDNRVRSIFEDSKGNFWIGTGGDGLHLMDREKGTFTRLNYDPANPGKLTRPYIKGTSPSALSIESHVSSIFEDQEGRIWITAFPGGLNVYDPASGITRHFEAGKKEGDLTVNHIWHTFQSSDGVTWITTGGNGKTVYKVKKQDERFPFYDWQNAGLHLGGQVTSIVKDNDDNTWIGFNLAPPQLIRYDRKTGKAFPVLSDDAPDGILVRNILCLSLDREGALWIGTGNGLLRRDPQTGKFRRYLAEANTTWNRPVIQDRNGLIWIPEDGNGLYRLDPKSGAFINYRHDPARPGSIGSDFVNSVFEDTQGHIWVGGGGLNDISNPLFLDSLNADGKTFTHFIKKVEAGSASYLTADGQGNIWFADQVASLQKLNPAEGTRQKISSSIINLTGIGGSLGIPMAMGKDGKIWLYDGNNLLEFDPKTEQFHAYVESHGVHSVGTSNSRFHVASDGEMLIAGEQGFLAFYPEKIVAVKNNRPPDLRITAFRLLGERVLPGENSLLKKPVWQTSGLRLSHNQNVFAFSVACFDFHDPAAIQIEFMLEGYDRLGWRKDLREGETPTYVNVPPGDYTFRVRGADSQGTWNMEGVSLQITILPPWWKTWWAYTIYVLLLIVGIFSVDRFQRKRIAEKEQAKSREKELIQAKEIEKAYTDLKATQSQLIQSEKMASLGELTAGIAHEIQNPLNFVNNFSEVNTELAGELLEAAAKGDLSEVQSLAKSIKDNEDKISSHGRRADGIVKSMLQHSRASSGQKELTDINALCDEYLRLAYHGFRAKDKSFNSRFKTDLDPSLPKAAVVPQDIGRVILNLINNAFHAVGEKAKTQEAGYEPEVTVSTTKTENRIQIKVKDNGPGIPDNIKEKIFQPFFTTKPAGQGTGLGLSLSYDIIKGHGGQVNVSSSDGTGTEFLVTLPL
jgi:signal transduction histidine kinase/ligand-binding sensor domain-containing protein